MLTIPKEYHLAVFGALLIAFEYFFLIHAIIVKNRVRIFRGTYMKQFNEVHEKHFKERAPLHGFPDIGNGFYSK